MGFFEATCRRLGEYDPYLFRTAKEYSVEGGSSQVDYDALVNLNDESMVLVEAKSPSVIKKVGELLPPRGIELKWVCGQSLGTENLNSFQGECSISCPLQHLFYSDMCRPHFTWA